MAPAGGDSVAVSRNDPPSTIDAGGTCVWMVIAPGATVVKFEPVPVPVCRSVAVPVAPPSSFVWMPASARESFDGTLRTNTVHSIPHVADAPPTDAGPRTTDVAGTRGVNEYLS